MNWRQELLVAGFFVASVAGAEESGPARETPVPAPLSRFSAGVHLAYWHAKDLDDLDLDGAYGGGVIGQFRVDNLLALELRLGGLVAGHSEDTYESGHGWYENDLTIAIVPFEAGLVVFLPLGEKFSLYGGPGAGYYLFDGEFRRAQGPWETTCDLDLDDAGGYYALLGARVQLARNAAVFLEGKYTWVESSLKHDGVVPPCLPGCPLPDEQTDLDFSGWAIQAGLLFSF